MHTQISSPSYGHWPSAITAEMVAEKTIHFSDVCVHQDGRFYWLEHRPSQQTSQSVIVSCLPGESPQDETDSSFHVTSYAHGYGGGAFSVKKQFLIFYDAVSGHVYCKNSVDNTFSAITSTTDCQYGDFEVDPTEQFVYCLRKKNDESSIVRICLNSHTETVLLSGADFYSNFRISPNGKQAAWLQWNHPNMPWDQTLLWIGNLDPAGNLSDCTQIEQGKNQAFYQPEWSPANALFVSSDLSGFWQLYRVAGQTIVPTVQPDPKADHQDIGRPLWVLGTRCYGFVSDTVILACGIEQGIWKLYKIDTTQQSKQEIQTTLTCIQNFACNRQCAIVLGGNGSTPLSLFSLDTKDFSSLHQIRACCQPPAEQDISLPQPICFPTTNNDIAYGFYYAPKNSQVQTSTPKQPPLIVKAHGGPTTNAEALFNWKVQYYTSRGFAYLEVNYRGSTGYGKEYREKLKAKWGIFDVDDCQSAAQFLCQKNQVDPSYIFLTGSSSGGFTVLSALTFKSSFYKAASCFYGIADLIALSEQTHKFETFYDQGLIGADIKTEEGKALYAKRSPLHSADQIKTPILFFHGEQDPVVSVEQTKKIAEKLKTNHVPHSVFLFPQEGHGFKKPQHIITSLEAEIFFFKSELN